MVVGAIFAIFLPSLKQLACAVEYHPKYSHFILTYREVARNSVTKLPSWWCGLGANACVKKSFENTRYASSSTKNHGVAVKE